MTQPVFDKEKIYDEKISPLMAQIIAACKEHGIPMLATFCYRSGDFEEDGTISFCTTSLDDGKGWHPDALKEACHIIRNGGSTTPKLMAFTITAPKT